MTNVLWPHFVGCTFSFMLTALGFSAPPALGSQPPATPSAAVMITHPETGKKFSLFPYCYTQNPRFPSPWKAPNGTEIVVGRTGAGHFVLLPVTVENDVAIDWSKRRFTKGKQNDVDAKDFPELAVTGLHDPDRLQRVTSITGRSLDELNRLGRPNGLSGAGFMATDENIIAVLWQDDELVRKLRLTHPQMARPLFHVWNAILQELDYGSRQTRPPRFWHAFSPIEYNGCKVVVKGEGTKGFQESLFNDDIKGNGGIKISRELTPAETAFLNDRYAHLSTQQMDQLTQKLTQIQMSEMEPYYVMRYGFYEGHTPWRVDPIAIAFIFGLRSLNEIEAAFPRSLHRVLTSHYVDVTDSRRQPRQRFGSVPHDRRNSSRVDVRRRHRLFDAWAGWWCSLHADSGVGRY